jgi:uncharacterized protein YqeY
MNVYDQLMADLKTALREQDELRKGTIRMALSALKYARVAKNADLTDEEMFAVLQKEVKQRQESIVEFKRGGRDDLVAQESAEIGILEPYLPKMLGREEIAEVARAVISEVGASSSKQMGQVMRVLMPRVHGQADGRLVNEVVKELLSGKTG